MRGDEGAFGILFNGMLRGACALVVVVLLAAPHAHASGDVVVLEGMGAAHGFGMAMDGVEGQARAGWSHQRILDLFYPGTSEGRTGGTVRVGLGTADAHTLALPGGGVVSDVPSGAGGLRVEVAPHSSVTVALQAGRLVVGAVASEEGTPTPPPQIAPTPPVELPATPPAATPVPTEAPPPPPPPPPPTPPSTDGSVWIVPGGDPAVTMVGLTGRRYRGSIEIRRDPAGGLVAVNHVDLENYVAGIAEEKGQGWPVEGLAALAIAARSLAAASMTWYARNHPNGYDICPTANCQVYLGYDGEEPAMRRAGAETAGRIRTYKGTAILAMYHGNGGGQTESYAKMAGKPEDVHPYLRSVRYPFAEPKQWRFEKPIAEVAATLASDDAVAARGVPSRLERIEITERGESPRVARVRLVGAGGSTEVSGSSFARALGLPSTWFSFPERSKATVVAGRRIEASDVAESASNHSPGGSPWGPLASFAALALGVALVVVVMDVRYVTRGAMPPILARRGRLNVDLARSARRRVGVVVARLSRRRH